MCPKSPNTARAMKKELAGKGSGNKGNKSTASSKASEASERERLMAGCEAWGLLASTLDRSYLATAGA